MQSFKHALTEANIEIYGEDAATLRIAERHRFHLMDSGVEVRVGSDGANVVFALRAERSDFPHIDASVIFERILAERAASILDRGYAVDGQRIIDVHDPIDSEKLLDVWYEIEFAKHVSDPKGSVDEIRWALTIDKYVKAA